MDDTRLVWPIFGVMFGLMACAPAPAAPVVTLPPMPPIAKPAAAERRVGAWCDGADTRVYVPTEVGIDCYPKASCWIRFRYSVHNCGTRPVTLSKIEDDAGIGFEFDPSPERVVAPGEARSFEYPPIDRRIDVGRHLLSFHLTREDETLDSSSRVLIVDRAFEAARADCIANGRDWGPHGGMFAMTGCQEIMRDAGQICHDGRDCQGRCVLAGTREVAGRQFLSGRCSRFESRSGCHAEIEETEHGFIPKHTHLVRSCY